MRKSEIYKDALWALADRFISTGTVVMGTRPGGRFGEILESLEVLQTIREDYEHALDMEETKEDYNL